MDLKKIYKTIPPWEWPEDIEKKLLGILQDKSVDLSNRLIAAEMAGDLVVFNDKLAGILISIVSNNDEDEALRAKAAIAFGPAFEQADLYEFEDPDDIIMTEEIFSEIQESFKTFFHDSSFPKEVRRCILEAAVRAPLDWHADAIRTAFASSDEDWQLTSVFCMRFVNGFDQQIMESLKSKNQDILYQAILAAGNWGLTKAWPTIALLFSDSGVDKNLLLAAIEAAAGIGTPEAIACLWEVQESDDEDIVEAAEDALAMLDLDDFDDEYDD